MQQLRGSGDYFWGNFFFANRVTDARWFNCHVDSPINRIGRRTIWFENRLPKEPFDHRTNSRLGSFKAGRSIEFSTRASSGENGIVRVSCFLARALSTYLFPLPWLRKFGTTCSSTPPPPPRGETSSRGTLINRATAFRSRDALNDGLKRETRADAQ